MNKKIIKTLAENSMTDGEINSNVINFAIDKLNKSDLKTFLFYLKRVFERNIIYIRTPGEIDKKADEQIMKIFKNKKIQYIIDKSLGAGMYIKANNDVYDMSVKGMIEKAIFETKNNL